MIAEDKPSVPASAKAVSVLGLSCRPLERLASAMLNDQPCEQLNGKLAHRADCLWFDKPGHLLQCELVLSEGFN